MTAIPATDRDCTRRRRRWGRLLVALLVVLGTLLRIASIPRNSLRVDEAESSINALTILEHGYPTDHYLGLPIYENSLLLPWPESTEYEFRDISYSERGCAIYHGWLPLYCMAASFAICGIEPDRIGEGGPAVRHSREDWAWRTIVPRIPSILFSLVFLLVLYALANKMYGPPAAWAALVGASLADTLVGFGWQARYYSAALALSTATGLALWNLGRHGRWRDFLSAGILLVLLFHTHLLCFVSSCVLLLFLTPAMIRQRQAPGKIAALTGLVVAGTLPWIVATGFLTNARAIPKAWSLLRSPREFFLPLGDFEPIVLVAGVGLAVFLGALAIGRRFRQDVAASWRAFGFALAWLAVSWLSFVVLIPAVSFWKERLVLCTAVPALLFASLLVGAACSALSRRYGSILACLGAIIVLGGPPRGMFALARTDSTVDHHWSLLDAMRQWDIEPGTRIYATPNDHLTLTYLGGIPIQSIAPVRRSFLESHPGRIIILECAPFWPLPLTPIVEAGAAFGLTLTLDAAREWSRRVSLLANGCHVAGRVSDVRPQPGEVGEFARHLIDLQRAQTRERLSLLSQIPVFRGFRLQTCMDKWRVFKYRFTDPPRGNHRLLNYENRVRNATARVMPRWVILDSKEPGS